MAKKQLKTKNTKLATAVNKYPKGGWKKETSFGAKLLKYIPAVSRSVGSKVLGPLSLLLGANKAYAPPVTDNNTGINRYTGNQDYTPFGQDPDWGTSTPPPTMSGQEVRDISSSLPQYQNGGMYNQMQQYQQGGVALPGGQMQPIAGSDAVEFTGDSHEQGGIELDQQTEVEGGETMDQVTMKDGGKRDYFFSQHLQKGGKSFSARHKQILEMGGGQNEIDNLAKIQEDQAGRDPGAVVNTAATGGLRQQYATGGAAKKKALSKPGAYEESGIVYHMDGTILYRDINGNGIDDQAEGVTMYQRSAGNTAEEEMEDGDVKKKPNNSNNTDDKGGDAAQVPEDEVVAAVDDATDNEVKEGNITEPGNYKDEEGNHWKLDNDGNWQVMNKNEFKYKDETPLDLRKEDGALTFQEGLSENQEEGDGGNSDVNVKRSRNIDGTTISAMAGQFLPAMRAMADDPDYMGLHQAGAASPAMSPELGRTHLKRVSMNAEREANAGDLRSMNKFIENSGAGPAGIANRMAAYAKKQQGDRQISAQEAKINADIANKEALINQDSKKTNIANMQQNTMFNSRQQNALNMFNEQQGAATDEFNKAADAATSDRRLMGLQAAMTTFAGINKDRLSYEANDRMAQAISGPSGVLSREELARDLAKAHPDMNVNSTEFQELNENMWIKMLGNQKTDTNNG